ncbi:MAG: MgtC/SapB family protein [Patescibacteria group bacterium]
MLTLEQMLLRLGLAVLLGIIIGLEREIAGKEAGLRTDMMVAAGAAIFTIAGLSLPYLVAVSPENLPEVVARNSGFLTVIANIVIGIGFLGAGIIVKHGIHVRGLTTAATVWFVAAIGVLCGIGLTAFAVISGIGLTIILEIFRRANIGGVYGKDNGSNG